MRRYRFITLVDIPADWPVSLLIRYGDSNYIKAIYLIDDFKPLLDYDQRLKQGILESWDARKSGWSHTGLEPGGLMCNEPSIKLGKKLPDRYIKSTKDLRLLYHGEERRKKSAAELGWREKRVEAEGLTAVPRRTSDYRSQPFPPCPGHTSARRTAKPRPPAKVISRDDDRPALNAQQIEQFEVPSLIPAARMQPPGMDGRRIEFPAEIDLRCRLPSSPTPIP